VHPKHPAYTYIYILIYLSIDLFIDLFICILYICVCVPATSYSHRFSSQLGENPTGQRLIVELSRRFIAARCWCRSCILWTRPESCDESGAARGNKRSTVNHLTAWRFFLKKQCYVNIYICIYICTYTYEYIIVYRYRYIHFVYPFIHPFICLFSY